MSEHSDGAPLLPETIPSINAVEFAAAMTASWERQTNRVIMAVTVLMLTGVGLLSLANWGVQSRLSRSALLLESTRANVVQTQTMLKSLQEDRRTDETRFRTLMAAVTLVGQRAEQFRLDKAKR